MTDDIQVFTPLAESEGDAELLAWLDQQEKRCSQVQGLDLFRTQISDVGLRALAAQCPDLLSLNLALTQVTMKGVVRFTRCCQKLRVLNLNRLRINDAAVQRIGENCPHLRSVSLGQTKVTDTGVTRLAQLCSQLTSTNLFHTKITDAGVAELAGRCPNLEVLELGETRVADRGVSLLAEHCPGLRVLYLYATQVTDTAVQKLVEFSHKLEVLNLSRTQVNLPENLKRSDDARKILSYFREARVAGARLLLEIKMPILGMGRVGKSQLARRLCQQPHERNAPSTHAFEQFRITCSVLRSDGTHECLLRLFDFGGQPEMHGAHRFFLADERNVYLILVSARKSLDENRLDYWLAMVRRHAPSAPVVVIITHNDDQPAANEYRYRPPTDPLKHCDLMKLWTKYEKVRVVYGYSNETGTNFDRVQRAIREAAGEAEKVFAEPFNPNFFKVHAWAANEPSPELADLPAFERSVHVTTFRQVCAAVGQTDPKQQDIWLRTLRDLGLLHFLGDRPEVKRNEQYAVLQNLLFNPVWVKGPVYRIVEHTGAPKQNGVLSREQLLAAFADLVPEEVDRERILTLMAGCELIFRTRDGDRDEPGYLIVDAIPSREPTQDRTNWSKVPRTKRRLLFDFLPDSLLAQLLGRWIQRVAHGFPYYRDDVVFDFHEGKGGRMRLMARVHDHAIDVEFEADRETDCNAVLAKLLTEFNSLLDPEGVSERLGEERVKVFEEQAKLKTELTKEDNTQLTTLDELLCQSLQLPARSLLDRLKVGFVESLKLKTDARKRAYRICWAFVVRQACNGEAGKLPELKPLGTEKSDLEPVIQWLRTNPSIATVFPRKPGGKTEDTYDNLRKTYGQALTALNNGSGSRVAGPQSP